MSGVPGANTILPSAQSCINNPMWSDMPAQPQSISRARPSVWEVLPSDPECQVNIHVLKIPYCVDVCPGFENGHGTSMYFMSSPGGLHYPCNTHVFKIPYGLMPAQRSLHMHATVIFQKIPYSKKSHVLKSEVYAMVSFCNSVTHL